MTLKLPAGSLKLLLIDLATVERNVDRGENSAAPVAIVAEQLPDGSYEFHTGFGVTVNGPSQLTYSQHSPLLELDRKRLRAAYSTTAEVVIDTGAVAAPAEVAAPAPAPSKPQKPKTKPTITTEEEANA
jgi:hypothetical protein